MRSLIPAMLATWVPVTVILFRALGPQRAALISLLGGFLLLPRPDGPGLYLGIFAVNKMTVGGLALLAGSLAHDPRVLLRARPRMLDLPMIAFVLAPIASLAANRFAAPMAVFDQVFGNFAAWSLPYLIGRLYFGDRQGPRRIAVGIAVAGLCSIPIYAFEMLAGPRHYLAGMVYGIGIHENMVSRLGGWRPEGFQTSGIEVSTWMALATTVAAWLWLRDGWRPAKIPAWLPALALLAATLACRGVYGYLNLAIGLVAVGATHFLRTRAVLIALAMIPPAYIVARATGAWDGQALVRLVARTGRSDTVAYRLRAEDSYVKMVAEHGALFGYGGLENGVYDFWAKAHLWPDGWWVHQFRSGGAFGVSIFLVALFLVPVAVGIAIPAGQTGRASPGSVSRGLTLFVLLHAIDSVQNMDYLTPTPLIGGCLVGLFLSRRVSRPDIEDPTPAGSGTEKRPAYRASVATAIVLIVLEVLGRMPRSQGRSSVDEVNAEVRSQSLPRP